MDFPASEGFTFFSTLGHGSEFLLQEEGNGMFRQSAVLPAMFSVFAILATIAIVPQPSEAQEGEVTCGGCEESGRWFFKRHWFPDGGDGCEGSSGDDSCSRCGGDSECHTDKQRGACHIACGPGGGDYAQALTKAVSSIRLGLDARDAPMVAAMILSDRTGLLIEYQSESGRINFNLACNAGAPATVVAVPPDARSDIEAHLKVGTAARLSAAPVLPNLGAGPHLTPPE